MMQSIIFLLWCISLSILLNMKSIMAMYHYYFLKTVIYWQLICRICRGIVHFLDIRLWTWMEIDIWSCGDLSYRNCAQDIGVIFHIFIDQHFSISKLWQDECKDTVDLYNMIIRYELSENNMYSQITSWG